MSRYLGNRARFIGVFVPGDTRNGTPGTVPSIANCSPRLWRHPGRAVLLHLSSATKGNVKLSHTFRGSGHHSIDSVFVRTGRRAAAQPRRAAATLQPAVGRSGRLSSLAERGCAPLPAIRPSPLFGKPRKECRAVFAPLSYV